MQKNIKIGKLLTHREIANMRLQLLKKHLIDAVNTMLLRHFDGSKAEIYSVDFINEIIKTSNLNPMYIRSNAENQDFFQECLDEASDDVYFWKVSFESYTNLGFGGCSQGIKIVLTYNMR